MTLHSLPLFVRVAGRPVILLGAGEAADAKRRLLERAGAVVVGEDADAPLAIVAIADEAEALAAVARLKARGVLVNAVDRAALCDFTLPAIVEREPVIVAVATGGVSAGLAAALRQRLEALLPVGLGELARGLEAARGAMRARWPDAGERRRALGEALSMGGALDPFGADRDVEAWLAAGDTKSPIQQFPGEGRDLASGCSQLGPGLRRGTLPGDTAGTDTIRRMRLHSPDPDDLTLRQARALAQADRLYHAPGVPAAILDRARADAARVVCAAPPVEPGEGLSVWLEMAG